MIYDRLGNRIQTGSILLSVNIGEMVVVERMERDYDIYTLKCVIFESVRSAVWLDREMEVYAWHSKFSKHWEVLYDLR
jgi:hypothetical protein